MCGRASLAVPPHASTLRSLRTLSGRAVLPEYCHAAARSELRLTQFRLPHVLHGLPSPRAQTHARAVVSPMRTGRLRALDVARPAPTRAGYSGLVHGAAAPLFYGSWQSSLRYTRCMSARTPRGDCRPTPLALPSLYPLVRHRVLRVPNCPLHGTAPPRDAHLFGCACDARTCLALAGGCALRTLLA